MSDVNNTRTNFRASSDDLIPAWLTRFVLGLVLAVLTLVTLAKLTDRPLEAVPPNTPILAERSVVLRTAHNGATQVFDPSGDLIEDIPAREGGFISGITRVIERIRKNSDVPLTAPIAIQLRDANRITLVDPATGWSAELASYGADNVRTFAKLLGTTSTAEGSQ